MSPQLYPLLNTYINNILKQQEISDVRKALLKDLSEYISNKKRSGDHVQLMFICTHNSRRSHMGQLWAQVAAAYYGITDIDTFSGGTEATAFNPRAVTSMSKAGFKIAGSDNTNPRYEVSFSTAIPPMNIFSKKFDDQANPSKNFAAIMTCSEADDACPIVIGADVRIPLHYEDPKAFDGTEQEAKMYDERCQQIAAEMFYMLSKVKV